MNYQEMVLRNKYKIGQELPSIWSLFTFYSYSTISKIL